MTETTQALGVFPSGTVGLVRLPVDDGDREQHLPTELVAQFDESTADGMTSLASVDWQNGLSPLASYWRGFSRRYFQSLCRSYSGTARGWVSPDTPSEAV